MKLPCEKLSDVSEGMSNQISMLRLVVLDLKLGEWGRTLFPWNGPAIGAVASSKRSQSKVDTVFTTDYRHTGPQLVDADPKFGYPVDFPERQLTGSRRNDGSMKPPNPLAQRFATNQKGNVVVLYRPEENQGKSDKTDAAQDNKFPSTKLVFFHATDSALLIFTLCVRNDKGVRRLQ